MPYKGKAATQSGQGKDTIQPNSAIDTYMCHALAVKTRSEDTKIKAPIQKKIVASTSKEDFPVPLAGRDSPENSADAPALSGNGGTMRESPHSSNQASVNMNPLSDLTYERNLRPSDPELARDASNPVYGDDLDASNPVYGHDLKGADPDTDLRPAGMQPYAVGNQEEDADDDKDHQSANMEPYAVRYQEEDDDDDKDHQPANMEPYATYTGTVYLTYRTTNSDPKNSPYAVTHELTMPYKGKAATQSGQGKDTIQPNSDTYMCHALAMKTLSEDTKTVQPNSDTYMCHALAMKTRSEDTKTKAPIQKKIVASTSKEDFPVPLAGRDSPENSADAPALSGGVGTMRESAHPPNQASVHTNPLSNFTHEHNQRPSDPELARDASNPVYGHDPKGTDPDTDLRPAGMQSYAVRYQEEDAAEDKDHQPADMVPYAVKYQEEDDDDDKDHQPAGMEPYAVRYQEEDAADDKDHRPASMQPYAVRYQDEDADDDNDHRPASMEPYAVSTSGNDSGTSGNDAGTSGSGNDAGTSVPRRADRKKRGTRKPRHAQGVPHGPREAAGGTTPMQQTDWQARADAVASIPNPMYASRAGTTPNQQTDWQARADAVASIPNPMYASRAGTTPMQQTDWQARADAVASVPNPMYASRAGTTPKPQTDWQARADAAASIPNPMYASRADRQYPGGPSGCRALCSFIRSRLTYIATGIALLLILVAVGLALLALINNEEISEQTTTVDVQTTTVDALKCDQDNMSTSVDALKRDQDNMPTTVDALKRGQDDMHQLSTTVDALTRDQDDMRQLSTTVDALTRDQDDMRQLSTTVDALTRDQDDMRQLSTTTDALKRDLDKERSRTGPILEQRLDETSKTPGDHDSRKNSEPFLLVADRLEETIIQVNITSGSKVTLPLIGVGQPLAQDFDPLTDYVYWSDYWNGNIKRARRDGSGMETIIDTDDSLVYGLALDHAGGNIYWSVSRPATISVAKKDGSSARTLLTSPAIGHPEQLVLDPRNELMYWVEYIKGSICRAAMDGSDQTTIITGLNRPRAITIDFTEDRLYYSNQRNRIYSSDLLGNDIRQVLYEDGKDVHGIAVDEDFVYWSSNWRDLSSSSSSQGKIGKLSKSDQTKTVLVDGIDYPWGIYLSTAAPPGVTTESLSQNFGDGSPTAVPQKFSDGSPTGSMRLGCSQNQRPANSEQNHFG
uniref:DUF5050 domain-containing protein n=1 Tax=Branchiostoma floridae TaxID=7739 RepID=C3ZUD7_BRAFL|eukprot:XP_002587854.1 hypothetical protein BRAFLDRAFT_94109 [Branchiostoma floridae]